MPQDRAAAATTTVLAIISDALLAWLHRKPVTLEDARAHVESFLRDEFSDVAKQTMNEIRVDIDN